MKFTPHPFQQVGIDHVLQFFREASRDAKVCYAAPTGCGKSIVELSAKEQLGDGYYIVSPRTEIIDGMMDKLDATDPESHGIFTPIRLRNLLLKGEVPHPKGLIVDEGHHVEAETYKQLELLTGLAPTALYTASPYRGSPRSTRQFKERFGEPIWIISFAEAAQQGYIAVPYFEILPLVDDDVVDISGGEFSVESIESFTMDRLGDAAEHSKQWYSGHWDVPTVYALPSSDCCKRLQQEMLRRGLPALIVSAETSRQDRLAAFEATKACIAALLHINIVSEGVDLPLRRLVDLAPTLSPVKWVQQLGRITRPTQQKPQYICTNRNLLRHAYALEGAVPVSAVVATEAVFGPSQRAHSRALGLEALGRFKPSNAKLISGAQLYVYSVATVVESVVLEYCCLVHPTSDPVWALRANTKGGKYGSWVKCDPPDDVKGFSSISPRAISDKQKAWWSRSAHRYGLDSSVEPDKKSFQALPVLSDLGVRLC